MLAGCGRFGFDGEQVDAGEVPADASSTGILQLSFRGSSPCVRSSDGRVACWGENEYGQLGRGTLSPFGPPEVVPLANVVEVATGENTTFAIDADGALWGWGDNNEGQLGLGVGGAPEPSPRRVTLPPVVEVAAGQFHTCALTDAGDVYCWGANTCGQLGSGTMMSSATPAKVEGISGATHIAVTDQQTCAVDNAGGVLCFGAAWIAGSTCQNLRLSPTPPLGLPPVVSLAGGCHMSTCATDIAGAAWCWGQNVFGVLGDGTQTDRPEPVQVMIVADAKHIGVGYEASCAATTQNDVFCWGRNNEGQLGIGTSAVGGSNAPLQLPFFAGALEIDQIEVGCNAACVRSGEEIYCWGENGETIVDDTGGAIFAPARRAGLPF